MPEPRAYSLAARLALITAFWSACALLVTGIVLTHLFRRDAERNFDARIEADLVHLIRTATTLEQGKLVVPQAPLGPRFSEPFSGWAWQIRRNGAVVAQSASLGPVIAGVAEALDPPGAAPADFTAPGGIAARGAARDVALEGAVTFAVARPRAEIDEGLAYFSRLLLWSLVVFGLVMFAASLVLTRLMLGPVSRLEQAVRQMRDGRTAPLEGQWPREIAPVVDALKEVNAHVARLVERSRNQSADMAHALKTPLTIIRQIAERTGKGEVTSQLDRIEHTLDWHLQRRRMGGPHYARVEVAKVADDVLFAMGRLFQDRALELTSDVQASARFIGDAEDLHEILGNLAENACKWAKGRVSVSTAVEGPNLAIRVEDDGSGISDTVAERVFRRGARLDESVPGHGHGLAIVRDIAALYRGEVEIGRSELGGAAVTVTLPRATAARPRRAR